MELHIDLSQVNKAFALLGKENAHLALARALNRTSANAKTAMTKIVAQDLGVKQAVVRDRLTIWKADSKSLFTRLNARTGRLPLIDFGAKGPQPSRGRGRGVRAKLPAPAKGTYPNAFIARMNGGYRAGELGVLQRAPGAKRLPVYELYGPSIANAFMKRKDVAQARGIEMLRANVEHEIQYLVSQAKQ